MINSEDARLVAHVSFSPAGAAGDLETVNVVMESLRNARANGELAFPDGNFELQAVGSFQNQIEANTRLMWIIPAVVLINLLLHYLHFRNFPLSLVVFSGIPFAASGGMIAAAVMGVEMNTAMWIMQLLGRAHSVDVGAKRYVDVLLSEDDFRSGVWWGSKKGLTGELADQLEHWPEIIGNESAQDNVDTVIHRFLE